MKKKLFLDWETHVGLIAVVAAIYIIIAIAMIYEAQVKASAYIIYAAIITAVIAEAAIWLLELTLHLMLRRKKRKMLKGLWQQIEKQLNGGAPKTMKIDDRSVRSNTTNISER